MTGSDNERLHDAHARLLARALGDAGSEPGDDAPLPTAQHDPPVPLQDRFGPYRLTETLGHGGQGVVYRAVDTRLDREVALKLLSAHGAATATSRARFEREAATVSRVRHPNLCTVYEAGEIDGQRFLAMEFVDGQSLAAWAAGNGEDTGSESRASSERRARVSRAFELVEQVARAVHAAHRAGIVHRDLKPANVMLRADGSPVVLDFGLAGDESDSDAGLTMPGDVLGTPAYMPPERVRGVHSAADPREDVYGLGAILYECLTGARPFEGHTREQLYRRILTEPVADPRRSNPAVPPEARFVLETALEKDPDRRYASAEAFADDVGRLRRREPIQARPVPVWTRAIRWVQRDPRVAVPTLAAFALLLTGITVTLTLLAEVRQESTAARVRALLAASSNESNRGPQRALLLTQAASRMLGGSAGQHDVPADLLAELRSAQIEALSKAHQTAEIEHLVDDQSLGAVFTAEGTEVVLAFEGVGEAPALSVHRPGDPEPHRTFHIEDPLAVVRNVAFDEERQRVLLTTSTGTSYVVSYPDCTLLHTLTPSAGEAAAFRHGRATIQFLLPGNQGDFVPGQPHRVVTGNRDGLRLWRLDDGVVAATEVWHDAKDGPPPSGNGWHLSQIAISDDGRFCASGSHDGWLRVLRLDDGKLLGEARASSETIRIMAFDPRRPLLLTSAIDAEGVRIWPVEREPDRSTAPFEPVATLPLPETWARAIRFAPSRASQPTMLAITDQDRRLHLYESSDGDERFTQILQTDCDKEPRSLQFSPDGRRVAMGEGNRQVEIYDLAGNRLKTLQGGLIGSHIAWSPNGDRIISYGGNRQSSQVWRVEDPTFRIQHLPRPIGRLATAGDRVVAGMFNGSIAVLDPGEEPRYARGVVQIPRPAFALRRDGQQLAVGGNFGRFDLWDLSGERPVRMEPKQVDVGSAPLNPNNITYDETGQLLIALWGRAGNGRLLTLDPQGSLVSDQGFPGFNGYGALVRHEQRTMLFSKGRVHWDLSQGDLALARPSPFPLDYNTFPVISADRRTVMLTQIGGGLGALSFLDPERREIVRHLDLGPATDPVLSADGSRVVLPARAGQVKVWDLTVDPPQLLAELRGHRQTVWAARFSADGSQIITAGDDRTVRYWPAHFENLDALVEERLLRDFTAAELTRYGPLLGPEALQAPDGDSANKR